MGHETETDTVRKQKMYNELGCVSCSVFPSVFPIGPPKFSSQEDFIQKEHRIFETTSIVRSPGRVRRQGAERSRMQQQQQQQYWQQQTINLKLIKYDCDSGGV